MFFSVRSNFFFSKWIMFKITVNRFNGTVWKKIENNITSRAHAINFGLNDVAVFWLEVVEVSFVSVGEKVASCYLQHFVLRNYERKNNSLLPSWIASQNKRCRTVAFGVTVLDASVFYVYSHTLCYVFLNLWHTFCMNWTPHLSSERRSVNKTERYGQFPTNQQ